MSGVHASQSRACSISRKGRLGRTQEEKDRSKDVGWRPPLVVWRPSVVGWRPSLVGWRPPLLGWRWVGGHL